MLNSLFSASLSLASTSKVTAVSKAVLTSSSLATGAVLTGSSFTFTVTVAVAFNSPSLMVYSKLSTPEKASFGV